MGEMIEDHFSFFAAENDFFSDLEKHPYLVDFLRKAGALFDPDK